LEDGVGINQINKRICQTLHFFWIWIYYIAYANTPAKPWLMDSTIGPDRGVYGWVLFGFISWLFFTILIILTYFRRKIWELFYWTHMPLAFLGIIFASLHHYHCILFMIPPLILLSIDYLIRFIKSNFISKCKKVKVFREDCSYIEIESFLTRSIEPGQYVFLNIPKIR
jgi:hypothetical protein